MGVVVVAGIPIQFVAALYYSVLRGGSMVGVSPMRWFGVLLGGLGLG